MVSQIVLEKLQQKKSIILITIKLVHKRLKRAKKNKQSQHPVILKSFDWFNEFVKSIKSSCSSGDKYSKPQLYKSKHIRQQFGQIGSDLTDYKNTSFKIEIHADVMLCTLTMAQERNKKIRLYACIC